MISQNVAFDILKLGAICQREFSMKSDFTCILVQYDLYAYRLLYTIDTGNYYPDETQHEEIVDLIQLVGFEEVRVGYSRNANTLIVSVIKEVRIFEGD